MEENTPLTTGRVRRTVVEPNRLGYDRPGVQSNVTISHVKAGNVNMTRITPNTSFEVTSFRPSGNTEKSNQGNGGRSSKAMSICSRTSSAKARKRVELEATKKIRELQCKLRSKCSELTHAQAGVDSIQKRIDRLNGKEGKTDEELLKLDKLYDDLADHEQRVVILTNDVQDLTEETKQDVAIINQELQLDIEDMSDDEDKDPVVNMTDEWITKNLPQVPNEDPIMDSADTTHKREVHKEYVSTAYEPSYNNENMMGQLVSALRHAFGPKQVEEKVIIKSYIDKDLPEFGGKPEEWMTFKAQFDRSTTKHQFDDTDNLFRLRKALVGSAKESVKHLYSNPENVKEILESLEMEFGRPEHVIENLISLAEKVKNIDVNKPETVIVYARAVQSLVVTIIGYHQHDYLNNVHLLKKLTDKLPPQLKKEWIVWYSSNYTRKKNLKTFSEWIQIQKEIACEMSPPTLMEIKDDKPERRTKRGPAAYAAVIDENEQVSEDKCLCCEKPGHKLNVCFRFKRFNYFERWDLVRKLKLCFLCLEDGHNSKTCKCEPGHCGKDACVLKHHQLLHRPATLTLIEKEEKPNESGAIGMSAVKGTDGPLAIVPVKLLGPSGTTNTYALLDTGATRTFIEKSIADDLGLCGESINFSCTGFGGSTTIDNNAMEVTLEISGDYKAASQFELKRCVTVDRIGIQPYSIDVDAIKKKWPHLRKMKGESIVDATPQIIIGNDNAKLMVPKEVLEIKGDTPIATRCKLGWVISGNIGGRPDGAAGFVINSVISSDDFMHNLIRDSFSTDNFGVSCSRKANESLHDKRAMDILESTTKKTGSFWETGLLWASDDVRFPSSKQEAMKRLISIEKSNRDHGYKMLYASKFEGYLKKGYIRKLTDDEKKEITPRTRYIPHFGVTNINKPGKLRLVFDAAATSNGVCLNDVLLKGPDLLRPLTSVLWNFRVHKVVIVGDIEDMFCRVKLRKEDQDSQRFLWRNFDPRVDPDEYVMIVLIFGSKSSPTSAIYVKNCNAKLFEKEFPTAVRGIIEDTYMDDCATGTDSIEDTIKLRQDITNINAAGDFHIKKWISNKKEVLESIPVDHQADGAKTFGEKVESERILGLRWEPVEDVFLYTTNFHKLDPEILKGKVPTKRQVCSLIMSLYDPLGFITHYKIKGMMILQDIWRSGIGWDDPLSEVVFNRWMEWLGGLNNLKHVKIPRWYGEVNNAATVDLHTFVDASEEAFSAVSYFVVRTEFGMSVAFVSSKARVCPLKKLTIPRMELQAAVMGARLANTILQEIRVNVNKKYFWSDSRTVLLWIRSESSRFKEFVANRIGEIQEISNISEWKWVPTNLNVADDATRFSCEVDLSPESRWFRGADFLYEEEEAWPIENVKKYSAEQLELKPTVGFIIQEETTLVDMQRFSSFTRMCRVTALAIKAAKYWTKTGQVERQEVPLQNGKANLLVSEVTNAEKLLVRSVQSETFGREIWELSRGNLVDKRSKIWKLSPILDSDGILRVNGRIDAATEVPEEMKRPAILPTRHHFTDLLIFHEHEMNAHTGQETVFNILRQKYWILDGRQAVRSCFYKCWDCKIKRAKPVLPEMGVLPACRLASYNPPFTYTGVDFFGPVEVTVGRHREKRWGGLFTCLVTRAVHIEVAHSLTGDEMMQLLSRFMDARGRPKRILSDNGTNFKAASKELKAAMQNVDFMKIMENKKFQATQWSFIPKGSPHMGGAWERLIQCVKKALYNMLKENYPSDVTLLTALKAAENIVNSRPLTHVSCDPDDEDCLTPNHFLRGFSDVGAPIPADVTDAGAVLRSKWKRSQLLAEHFWNRWSNEYLPDLLKREKWHMPATPLTVGEIVILLDAPTVSYSRNTWLRGVVSAVYPGKDGQVRVVDVSVRDFKTKKITVYNRPAAKVCPLGLKMDSALTERKIGGQNVAERAVNRENVANLNASTRLEDIGENGGTESSQQGEDSCVEEAS